MGLAALLGKRVRELRKDKKMSQAELAEATRLSDNYIALVEQGKRSPSLETIDKISKALKTSYEELFSFQSKDPRETAEKSLLSLLKGKSEQDILLVLKLAEAMFEYLSMAKKKRKAK